MNTNFPTEANHIPKSHSHTDNNMSHGPFVTAVFTVSNGDIHKPLDYKDYVNNNNHVSFVNENGEDRSKPPKSNMKKSALSSKKYLSVEVSHERKSVSFTDDTLDNENTTKALRKERHDTRRKQRNKTRQGSSANGHHLSNSTAPSNTVYTDDKEEEIETCIDFGNEQTDLEKNCNDFTDITSNNGQKHPTANGHVTAVANGGVAKATRVANGGLVSALVDLDSTESDNHLHQSSSLRPEESLDNTDLSPTLEEEFVYFDKLLRRVVGEQRRKKHCLLSSVVIVMIVLGIVGAGLALYFLLPR